MDLGREIKNQPETAPVDSKTPKVVYPGFCLSDSAAKDFSKENSTKLGDEYTITFKVKVTSLRQDEYGNSLGFDLISLDNVKPVPSDVDFDAENESKMLGYTRKKVSAPDVSAAESDD